MLVKLDTHTSDKTLLKQKETAIFVSVHVCVSMRVCVCGLFISQAVFLFVSEKFMYE